MDDNNPLGSEPFSSGTDAMTPKTPPPKTTPPPSPPPKPATPPGPLPPQSTPFPGSLPKTNPPPSPPGYPLPPKTTSTPPLPATEAPAHNWWARTRAKLKAWWANISV